MSRRGIPRAWLRNRAPSFSDRTAHLDADEFARRAELLAPILGFCSYCGCSVDEVNGKLHGNDCSVSEQRRDPNKRVR